MKVSQKDMIAFDNAPAGIFKTIDDPRPASRIKRLISLGMVEQVGFKQEYRLANINAACGTGTCLWVGLERERDRKPVIVGGVSCEREICPSCGSETYYRLVNANLVGGAS